MFYIALNDVNQNIERVVTWVKNGGHYISTEDIIRRNRTSFDHLYKYALLVDNLVLIDNSKDDGEMVLEVNDGNITHKSDQLPKWSLPIHDKFNNQ